MKPKLIINLQRKLLLAVLLLTASASLYGQTGTVTGTVLDAQGVPVVGATVLVEGTQNGVVTDLDGRYTLRNVPSNGLLRFSCLGYEDQVKHVNGANTVNAIIQEVSQNLDAGVVVAFGTQKKESVLASISTVKPTELKVPSSNLTTALAGRVAGLVSYQRSGEPV